MRMFGFSRSLVSRSRVFYKGNVVLGVGYDIISIRENIIVGFLCCRVFVKY